VHFITRDKIRLQTVCLLGTLALGTILSTPLRAQEAVLELDPAQTHIQFTLADVLHTVHGTFKLKRGTLRFDPATGKASGMVVVDVTSGESGNGSRDRKMHKDILQSQQYPEATFAPSQMKGSVNAQADSQIDIPGVFNLHGGDHQITLTFRVKKTGDQLTANTHFTIPYQQWGIKNPSNFFLRVSDKVEIDIQAVGRLSPATGN
jgi:polyisoprenoid-binding protein YceI